MIWFERLDDFIIIQLVVIQFGEGFYCFGFFGDVVEVL